MSGSGLKNWTTQRPATVVFLCISIPAVLLFLLMKAAGAGQVADAPTDAFTQKVQVMKAEKQSAYTRLVKVVGRVEASKQASLGFELGGTLESAYVDEGDRVKKGQVLAELDIQRLEAQMREIEASIARAKADARLAELSEQRVAKLVKERLESPQRLDETREATQSALAMVREMEARKDSVTVDFVKSKIVAPYDGTILTRPVDPGSVVGQGSTILTIQKDADTEVRMAMAADKAFKLNKGQRYQLHYGERQFTASLKSIANARTINTRTVDAIFEIDTNISTDVTAMVLPGDLLTLLIPTETAIAGYWVPKSSLTNGIRGMWNLFTVSSPDAEQSVVAKSVNVLYSDQSKAFVTGALEASDYVLVSGGQKLVPEQKVYALEIPYPFAAESSVELVSQ